MAFLRNDAVNRVNLHAGIQALAEGAGAIFFLVVLCLVTSLAAGAFLLRRYDGRQAVAAGGLGDTLAEAGR